MSNVRLHLTSRPENVALAREALAGLADTLSLSQEQYDDIRTAVTEACNNVVQHAYADGEGPMDMDIRVLRDAVEVMVRDAGMGIGHDLHMGGGGEFEIGLPVILALTERLQVGHSPEGGTEVQMRFRVPGTEALGTRRQRRTDAPQIELPELHAAARASFASPELARAILPRLACVLAARAHFSADRVSDVQLLCDALASQAPALANGPHLEVALALAPRELQMQLSPLSLGAGERLLSDSGVPVSVLETLADERTITAIGPDEVLVIRLRDMA